MEPALPADTPDQTVIGVVSDTHGLLRPEALKHLNGVDRIIHAGDIGAPNILEKLQTLAPVDAVRGNNDTSAAGMAAIISGHSHKPVIEEREGVLFINPGSIGPRRFRLPIALAKLYITADAVRGEIIELKLPG